MPVTGATTTDKAHVLIVKVVAHVPNLACLPAIRWPKVFLGPEAGANPGPSLDETAQFRRLPWQLISR